MKASPAKLKDGSWGARAPKGAYVGAPLEIETKAGKKWDAYVSRIVWEGNDACLVETSKNKPPVEDEGSSDAWGDFCGYRCPVDGHICTAQHPCHDCF